MVPLHSVRRTTRLSAPHARRGAELLRGSSKIIILPWNLQRSLSQLSMGFKPFADWLENPSFPATNGKCFQDSIIVFKRTNAWKGSEHAWVRCPDIRGHSRVRFFGVSWAVSAASLTACDLPRVYCVILWIHRFTFALRRWANIKIKMFWRIYLSAYHCGCWCNCAFELMCPLFCSLLKVYGLKDPSGVHWFGKYGQPNGKELTKARIPYHSHWCVPRVLQGSARAWRTGIRITHPQAVFFF